ncbi:hypothetical protein AB1K54_09010 [Microbacterium sp. BWT-B31]|uniref:hypothetical protein n=1 Tax=Microbacterium sp. BWT-B31 TaxID=3232072 RepID=UPI0035295D59
MRWVVPELQRRGVYSTEYTEYTEGTLRHRLHGRSDRLPPEHRGDRYRIAAAATV